MLSGSGSQGSVGVKITVLMVVTPFHVSGLDPQVVKDTPVQYKKLIQEHTAKMLGLVASAAKAEGACETVQVEHEHSYQAIINTARSKSCDLIVMASHERCSISAIVLGSQTVKVLTHSKIPVLLYR